MSEPAKMPSVTKNRRGHEYKIHPRMERSQRFKGMWFFHVIEGHIVFQRGYRDRLSFQQSHRLLIPEQQINQRLPLNSDTLRFPDAPPVGIHAVPGHFPGPPERTPGNTLANDWPPWLTTLIQP